MPVLHHKAPPARPSLIHLTPLRCVRAGAAACCDLWFRHKRPCCPCFLSHPPPRAPQLLHFITTYSSLLCFVMLIGYLGFEVNVRRSLIVENFFKTRGEILSRKGTQDTPKIICHNFLLHRFQLLYFLPLENEEIKSKKTDCLEEIRNATHLQ